MASNNPPIGLFSTNILRIVPAPAIVDQEASISHEDGDAPSLAASKGGKIAPAAQKTAAAAGSVSVRGNVGESLTEMEDRSYTIPLTIKDGGKTVQLEIAPPTPAVVNNNRAGGLGGLPSSSKTAEETLLGLHSARGSFATDPRKVQKERDARRGANRSAAEGDMSFDHAFDIDACSQTIAAQMKSTIVPQVAQRRNVMAIFSGYKDTNTSATMEAVLHTAMESLKGTVVSVAEAQNEALSMSADLPPTRRAAAALALMKMHERGISTSSPTGKQQRITKNGGGDTFPSLREEGDGGEMMVVDGSVHHVSPINARPGQHGGSSSPQTADGSLYPVGGASEKRGGPRAQHSPASRSQRGSPSPQRRASSRNSGKGGKSPSRGSPAHPRPGTNLSQNSVTSPSSTSKYSLLMARLPRDQSQIEVSEVSEMIARPLLPNLLDRSMEFALRAGKRPKAPKLNPDGSKKMKKIKKIVQVEVPAPDEGTMTVDDEIEVEVTDYDEGDDEDGGGEWEGGRGGRAGSVSPQNGKNGGNTVSRVRQRYLELRKPLGYPTFESVPGRGQRPSVIMTSIPGVGLRQGMVRALTFGPKHYVTCPYPDSVDTAMKANFGLNISFWICTGDGAGGPPPLPNFAGESNAASMSMAGVTGGDTFAAFGGEASISGRTPMPAVPARQMTAFHFTDAHEPNFMVRALLNTNDVGTFEMGFVLITVRDAHGRYLEVVFNCNPCDNQWHFVDINLAPKEKSVVMSMDGKPCRSRVTSQEQPTAFEGGRKKTIILGASPGEKENEGSYVLSGSILDFQVSRQGTLMLQYPLMEKGLVNLSDKTTIHTPKPRVAEVVNMPPTEEVPTHDYRFPRTAPYFDGRGAHINIGSLGDFAFFENGSTIEFTLKTTSIAESMTLIGVVDSKGHHPGFGVDLNTNTHGAFQRYTVCVWVADYAGNVIRCVADLSEAFDDRWHSVSIRLTDMFSGKFKFRLDNRPVESYTAVTQTPPSEFIRYEDYVTIGCLNDRGKTQSRFFKGSLKSMRLSKMRETPTGNEVLVFADWAFVEGPRSPIVFDHSGNGHNGVLVSGGGNKEFPWYIVVSDEEADAEDDLADQRMTVSRHDNNAVSVAVIAIVTRVDPKSGRCYDVIEDLVNNVTIKELETVPLAGFNPRIRRDDPRCFKGIPERCFKPVTPVDYQATIRKALRSAYGEHSSYALPQDQQEKAAAAAEAAAVAAAAAAGGEGPDAASESFRRGSLAQRSGLTATEQLRSHKMIVLRLGDAMFTCVDLASYTKSNKAKLLITPNQVSWTDINCTSGTTNKINNSINSALTCTDKLLTHVGQHPQLYKRTTLLDPATPTQYDNTLTNALAFNMLASSELCHLHYFHHLHSRSTRDEALYTLLLSAAMVTVDSEHAGMMVQKLSRLTTAKAVFNGKSQRKIESNARLERAKLLRKQYPGDILEKRKKMALVISCMDFPYDKHMPNETNQYQFNDVKTICRLFEALKFTTVDVLMDPSLNNFKKALAEKKAIQKKDDAQLVVYFMGTGMIDCYNLPPTPQQLRLFLEEEELDARRNDVLAEQMKEWLSLYEDHWFGMQRLFDQEYATYEELLLKNAKKKKKPAKGVVVSGPQPPKELPPPFDMSTILAEFSSWRIKIAPNVGQPINPSQEPAAASSSEEAPSPLLPAESGAVFDKLLRALRKQKIIPEADMGTSGLPTVNRTEVIIQEPVSRSKGEKAVGFTEFNDLKSDDDKAGNSDDGDGSDGNEEVDTTKELGCDGVAASSPPPLQSINTRQNSTVTGAADAAATAETNENGEEAGGAESTSNPISRRQSRKVRTKITVQYHRQQYLCLADTSVPISGENTITLDEVKRLVVGDRYGIRGNHSLFFYDCVSISSRTRRKTHNGSVYGGFGGLIAATGEVMHIDYKKNQILLLSYYLKKILVGAAVECVRIGSHEPPAIVTVDTAFEYLKTKFDTVTGKCPARRLTVTPYGEYVGDCYVAPFVLTTKNERRQQKTSLAGKKSLVRIVIRWNGVLGAEFKTLLQNEISKVCRSMTPAQCELKRVRVLDEVVVTLKAPQPITLENIHKSIDEHILSDDAEREAQATQKRSSVKKRLPLPKRQSVGGQAAAPNQGTLSSLRCSADYYTLTQHPVVAARLESDLDALFSAPTSKVRCPKFTYRVCMGYPPTISMSFLDASQYEEKAARGVDDEDDAGLSKADLQKERARVFCKKMEARTADTDSFVLGAVGALLRSNTRIAGLAPASVQSYVEAYLSLNDDDIQRLERAARRGASTMAHGDACMISVAALDDKQAAEYENIDTMLQLEDVRKNHDGKAKLARETDVRKKAEDQRKKLKDSTQNVNNAMQQIKTTNKFDADDIELCFSVPVPEVLATVLEGLAGVCSKATLAQFTSKDIGFCKKLELLVKTPPRLTEAEELQESVLGAAHVIPNQLDARQLRHYKVVSSIWKMISALAQCGYALAETHPRIFPALITATFTYFPAATISSVPFLKNVASSISAGGMSERNELLVPHGAIYEHKPTIGSIMRPKYDYLDAETAPGVSPEQFELQYGTRHFRHIFSRSIAPNWPALQCNADLKEEIEQLIVECVPCTVNDLLEVIDPTYLPENVKEHEVLGYEQQVQTERESNARLVKFKEAVGGPGGKAAAAPQLPPRRKSITAAEALGKVPVVSAAEKAIEQVHRTRREKVPQSCKFSRTLIERELITRCKKMKVSVAVVAKLLQLAKDDLSISEMTPGGGEDDSLSSPRALISSKVNTPGNPRSIVLLASLIYTLGSGTFDTVLSVHDRVHEMILDKYKADVEIYKTQLAEYTELINGKSKGSSRRSSAPPPTAPVAPVPPLTLAGTHSLPILDTAILDPHLSAEVNGADQREKFKAVLYVYADVVEFLDSANAPHVWDRDMLNVCGPAIVFAGKSLEKLRRRLLRLYANDTVAVQLLGGAMAPEPHQEVAAAQCFMAPSPNVAKGR